MATIKQNYAGLEMLEKIIKLGQLFFSVYIFAFRQRGVRKCCAVESARKVHGPQFHVFLNIELDALSSYSACNLRFCEATPRSVKPLHQKTIHCMDLRLAMLPMICFHSGQHNVKQIFSQPRGSMKSGPGRAVESARPG